MVKRNAAFTQIKPSYLFLEVASRKNNFVESVGAESGVTLINMGIGDTTEPLEPQVVAGLKKKADELATLTGYTGYGEFNGTQSLRKAISEVIYGSKVAPDEIYISDGCKPDLARLQFLCGPDATVAVQDPTYPVYVDSSVISGKAGHFDTSKNGGEGGYEHIVLMKCTPENNFFPDLSKLARTDIIYFCSPNNPTGSVATRDQLKQLVDFAKENKSIIVFDAAYGEFVRDTEKYCKSIFDIEGARDVAIETNSFSKSLGFTGVRIGWTVCPKELVFDDGFPVSRDWARIMGTFFNGPCNVAEAGALAGLVEDGGCIRKTTDYYLENARLICESLKKAGMKFYGGNNSPYVWVPVPEGKNSWDVFQELLENAHVVTTPGEGFGAEGKSFIRISAFGHRGDVEKGMQGIVGYYNKAE